MAGEDDDTAKGRKDESEKPERRKNGPKDALAREERLAKALRDNLRRRKAKKD